MSSLKFHAQFELWNDVIALRIRSDDHVATQVVFEKREAGSVTEPVLRLSEQEAQDLANSLWDAGIRPAQGRNSEGVTAAQAKHLEDMRAIAFTKLNVIQPGGKT